MAKYDFSAELAQYGPEAAASRPMTARRGRRYCRRLARRHYENFTVVSFLLPARLRQHFHNIYAYCRWADDLADEAGDPQRSLALLEWWELELRRCCQGQCVHPVFAALAETIREFAIPPEPLVNLLVAFRQDQRVMRYETFDQLLDYCRYSANPVGHLVLYLGRCFDGPRAILSDAICTGLQLVNFLQDVALDWARGRIYLPLAHCRHHGYDESMFARQEYNEAFRRLMAAEAAEAQGWLHRGLPLILEVPPDLRLDVALFVHGGLAALEAVRRRNYDVWSSRPALSRWEKLRLVARCWWRFRPGSPLEGLL
jgi:squalene synthase HpnC